MKSRLKQLLAHESIQLACAKYLTLVVIARLCSERLCSNHNYTGRKLKFRDTGQVQYC